MTQIRLTQIDNAYSSWLADREL